MNPAARRRKRAAAAWLVPILLGAAAAAGAGPGNNAEIQVVSVPAGAAVICDGRSAGTAPVTVEALEPGAHLLVLRKAGYEEKRQTVTVGPGEKAAVELVLEPVRGLALIRSDPPDAVVELDGAAIGRTPALLTQLPLGRHRLRLTKAGHLSKVADFAVTDRTPQEIMIRLDSDSAGLILSSSPPGATVRIDGAERGLTPCTIATVPAGVVRVQIQLAGHEPHTETLRLNRGETHKLEATLKPLPGVLRVVSIPPGGRVYVDDQYQGVTPADLDGLEPGARRVRVELRGYEPMTRAVEVLHGDAVTEEFRLARNSGLLELVTEPAAVQVFIDGEDAGMTKAKGTDVMSEPMLLDFLSPGDHKLQLTKKGYFPEEMTFTVQKDRTVTRHVTMKRRFVPDTIVCTGDRPTDTYRGVLRRKWPNGDMELECFPGVFKTFTAGEIRWTKPIAVDETRNVTPEE